MKRTVVLLFLFLSGFAAAKEIAASALIDKIVKDPGAWTQMCMMSPPIPATDMPVGGYVRLWTSTKIGDANFKLLRAERREVLQELSKRLKASEELAVKCTRVEIARAQGKKVDWPDADNRLEAYMMMLQDLNGVEALGALLQLEESVNKLALYDVLAKNPDPKWLTHPVHVQLLSTVTAILKNEGYKGLSALKAPVVYDQAHRDLIVKLGREFLKSTKPAAFKGAKAMQPVPHAR